MYPVRTTEGRPSSPLAITTTGAFPFRCTATITGAATPTSTATTTVTFGSSAARPFRAQPAGLVEAGGAARVHGVGRIAEAGAQAGPGRPSGDGALALEGGELGEELGGLGDRGQGHEVADLLVLLPHRQHGGVGVGGLDGSRRGPLEHLDDGAVRGLHGDGGPLGHQLLPAQSGQVIADQLPQRRLLARLGTVAGNDDPPHRRRNHSTASMTTPTTPLAPGTPPACWQPAGRSRRRADEPGSVVPPSARGAPDGAASGAPPSIDSRMARASSELRQRPVTQTRPLSQGASLSMTPSQSSSMRLHCSGRGEPGVQAVAVQFSTVTRHQPTPQVSRAPSSTRLLQLSSLRLQTSLAPG